MLRCTIELVPHGDETRNRVIGLVEIANTGTGTLEVGNYAVVLNAALRPRAEGESRLEGTVIQHNKRK